MERPHIIFGNEPSQALVPIGFAAHDYFLESMLDYLLDKKSQRLWQRSFGVAGELEDAVLSAELSPGQRKAILELGSSSYLSGKEGRDGQDNYSVESILQGGASSDGNAGRLSEAVEALRQFGNEVKGTGYDDRSFLSLLGNMKTFNYEKRQAEMRCRMSLSVPTV